MTDWRTRAACRNVTDARIFFPVRSNTPHAILAATHCRACPVATDCHQDAEDFGRSDGLVQGGAFWVAGKPHPIPEADAPSPHATRSAASAGKRREAINRYYEIRHQHKNDTEAYRAIADQYGVSFSTVYGWHRLARAEHSRRLAALNQTAREAA